MNAGWTRLIISAVVLVVITPAIAFAQGGAYQHESDISQATQIVMPSVVAVETRFDEPITGDRYAYWMAFRGARPLYGLWGTGFIYKDPDYVITAAFLMEHAEFIRVVLNDGRSYPAEEVDGSGNMGVAVLKVDWGPDMVAVSPPYGNSDELRLGQPIGIVGKALGSVDTFATAGIISAIRKETPGSDEPTDEFLQFDASYQLSFTGGPIIDNRGAVVGMVTRTVGVNLNLGVPVNDIIHVTDRLIAGEIIDIWHGLDESMLVSRQLVESSQVPAEFDPDGDGEMEEVYGRWISHVEEASPAAIAGIMRGDTIFEIDGLPMKYDFDWYSSIRDWQVGQLVILRFLRKDDFTGEWEVRITQMQIQAEQVIEAAE